MLIDRTLGPQAGTSTGGLWLSPGCLWGTGVLLCWRALGCTQQGRAGRCSRCRLSFSPCFPLRPHLLGEGTRQSPSPQRFGVVLTPLPVPWPFSCVGCGGRGAPARRGTVCLAEAQADTPWEPGWHCHGNGDNNSSCQAESRKGRDLLQCRGHTRPCQGDTGIPAEGPSCDIPCPSPVMAWTAVSTSLLW